jgi:hypothetical protein
MKQVADWNDFRAISHEPAADLQFEGPVSLSSAPKGMPTVSYSRRQLDGLSPNACLKRLVKCD